VPEWPGVTLHKITATIGGGVLVAKVQHPLEGCSRAVNIVSSISRVIPRLSSNDQEQTLAGSHQGVFIVKTSDATSLHDLVH
jgi:hypothetical protein